MKQEYAQFHPGVKVMSVLLLVVCVLLLPQGAYTALVMYAGMVSILAALLGVSFAWMARRVVCVSPFFLFPLVGLLFAKSGPSLDFFFMVVCKSVLSVCCCSILVGSTSWNVLLQGLAWMRIPQFVVSSMLLMMRYVPLLRTESQRMIRACASRTFSKSKTSCLAAYTNILGMLFVRSCDRSQRVYSAMQARGLGQEINTAGLPTVSLQDVMLVALVLIMGLAILASNVYEKYQMV